ncbi:uncharacterized protein LOC144313908 isoform X3 [Canis aureus]
MGKSLKLLPQIFQCKNGIHILQALKKNCYFRTQLAERREKTKDKRTFLEEFQEDGRRHLKNMAKDQRGKKNQTTGWHTLTSSKNFLRVNLVNQFFREGKNEGR